MDKSLLKSPLVIVIIAIVFATLPLLFDNENYLVIFRLMSFGLFFYAVHLFFNQRKKLSK
jgi:hypothetical protein